MDTGFAYVLTREFYFRGLLLGDNHGEARDGKSKDKSEVEITTPRRGEMRKAYFGSEGKLIIPLICFSYCYKNVSTKPHVSAKRKYLKLIIILLYSLK